ncbi:hypothetical protein chiPu_0002960 [Chiloscyllium punctatum]|uniref:Uncharacterized protein n=1 Tax=Chiloscyllium punctatum TaxID=137246 RepID=A0A401S2G3_CHIPU|nr:hypothetical protein [Chiloscyllium punctatum]
MGLNLHSYVSDQTKQERIDMMKETLRRAPLRTSLYANVVTLILICWGGYCGGWVIGKSAKTFQSPQLLCTEQSYRR